MNKSSGGGPGLRRRSRQWGRVVAVVTSVASIALLAAACGGGPPTNAEGQPITQKAIAYAQCMRSHGVPSYPDPDSQGQFPPIQEGRNGVPQQAVQSAQNACRHLQPGGGAGTAQQQQAKLTQALNFARCMRAHEVPDFPDPTTAGNGGMGFNMSGVDTHSPQYQSADRTCQSQSGKG